MIYHFRGKHGFLSNMYSCRIIYENLEFNSVEAAYIYAKHKTTPREYALCVTEEPGQLKKLSKSWEVVAGWDRKKLGVMFKLLKQKFSTEPLKSKLLATGSENIVEGNYWNDRFWGVDLKETPNTGENYLGRLLMEVRKRIRHGE